ncbi:MAG: asparaginase domain-containing protein [Alphaproteobacteria bacterium]
MVQKIHFILTGGTIEKAYDPLTEKPEFKHLSILPDYLRDIVKMYPDITFTTVSQIDSMEMTDDVRTKIAQEIKSSKAQQFVIVHGTSTMETTARFLEKSLEDVTKTIILTGAMIPLKEFAMSDGGFNLGYAIAQVQSAQSGVYIAMNARLFKAGDVTKNTDIGRFEFVQNA